MNWLFIDDPPNDHEMLDVRAANSWMVRVAEAFVEGFGEWNFAEGALPVTRLEDDAVLRFGSGFVQDVSPLEEAVTYTLPLTVAWLPVPSASLRLTMATKGGLVAIMASFNLRNPVVATSAPYLPGVSVGLAVDGDVYNESVIGSVDSNDRVDSSPGRSTDLTSGVVTPTHASGPGVQAAAVPLALHAVVRVPPGEHVFEVVYRMVEPHDYTANAYITTGQIIVYEMRA